MCANAHSMHKHSMGREGVCKHPSIVHTRALGMEMAVAGLSGVMIGSRQIGGHGS